MQKTSYEMRISDWSSDVCSSDLPLFNGAELRDFIEQADYVTVNDYESNLLQERTGWDEKRIAERVKAYIATRGPKGAVIHADGNTRSEERRGGKEGVRPGNCRWVAQPAKKKTNRNTRTNY